MEIKKFLSWALIALPLLAACDDDEKINNEEGGGGSNEVTMSNLTGEWVFNISQVSESVEESLVIKADGSFVNETTYYYYERGTKIINSLHRTEGKYKLEGTTLIGKITKAQYRYANWRNNTYQGLSDWENDEDIVTNDTAQVSLLRGGTVMIMQSEFEYEEDMAIYFKKGSNLPNNKSELNGTWFSMFASKYDNETEEINIAIKFDGDNIDLIVVPWSQRFICKYTYKDGIVSSEGEVTFRTLWRENGANEMNMENPFESEWLPTYDPEQYTGNLSDGFSFPFIVDGKKAYSLFVGRASVYTKQ